MAEFIIKGEIHLTYEKSSSLAFSINETVWVNRGSEIDELMSLSLEPDVTIHEENDQVLVRGSLQLIGEYRPKLDETISEGENDSLEDQISFRTVEEVSLTDEGVGVIRHTFPLDVTIPRERIHRLEDLYVTVDAFDYELPGKGCIQLDANVSISGITNERPAEEPQQEYGKETINYLGYGNHDNNSRANEADSSASWNDDREEVPYNNEQEDDVKAVEGSGKENRSFHYEAYREQPDEDSGKKDKEFTREYRDTEETDIEDERATEGSHAEEKAYTEPTIKFSAHQKLKAISTSYKDSVNKVEANSRDEDEETSDDDTKTEENALYLTSMLTKGEERFSKLRMCIVQDGESLETIADRYDMQVSNLIRMNRLNEDRVSEGQILYIPVKTPSSKS